MVVGCSQSGKSEYIKNMLLNYNEMFDPPPARALFCYSVWQKAYQELEETLGDFIEFRTSIPSKDELIELWNRNKDETILILDDKMPIIKDDQTGRHIAEIVCVLSHHCHVSCFLTTQNVFHNRILREISLNCHYMVLFKNSRSALQVKTLATQIMPSNVNFFMESYFKATDCKYGYLVIDLSPDSIELYRLRTKVFPENELIVFLPNK